MTVKVIAEIGVNWQDIFQAANMVEQAKSAGAYAVKFQLFNKEAIADSPLRDKLEKRILGRDDLVTLTNLAHAIGLKVIITPMFLGGVGLAAEFADMLKIRFRDWQNQELIDAVDETDKPFLISVPRPPLNFKVGEFVYNTLALAPNIIPLYCIPRYPPEPEDFNLDCACACQGFSSHFPHTIFDIAFVINRIYDDVFIEKHVMLEKPFTEWEKSAFGDSTWEEPIDKNVSITFKELKSFILNIALLERMERTRI